MKNILLFSLLILSGCTHSTKSEEAPDPLSEPSETKPERPRAEPSLRAIVDLPLESKCAKYRWKDRGQAPSSYLQGVSIVYARSVCQPDREDVKVISAPVSNDKNKDSLAWYEPEFQKLGLRGPDTLKNTFTLLIGLGMRESSGKYCCGRDMSANFSSADSAEAGIFQASWGARRTNPVLSLMFKKYIMSPPNCFYDVFSKNVSCSSGDAKNWGSGDGFEWQKMTKQCPAFATEYAAVLLRTHGGSKGEFGPIRRKQAEINRDCFDLLGQVDTKLKEQPELCKIL